MRILKLTSATERRLLAARRGRDAEAESVADRIVSDVHRRGDAALFSWAKKLDGVDLRRKGVWVSRRELHAAERQVSTEFLRAVRQAGRDIRRVAEQQLPHEWTLDVEPGVRVRQIVRPIESIGCYIPGGRFALVPTLLMTVVPAQVAGVERIVAVCPKANPELLAAASFLGIREMARIGGAQAIAALAYGTQAIPRVEKIFGPGNRYVTAAKQLVSAECAIDLPAGPTEAIVLATRGNPRWIAADLLAQAEHAPDAGSFLVTTSDALARRVAAEVDLQLQPLPPENPAHTSMKNTGAILLASSLDSACEFVNRFAAEHLSLPSAAASFLRRIRSSGTVFAGPWAAQPLGDYVTGSNHVLPTGGWARRRGGLSAADFVKCISVQEISRAGFLRLAEGAEVLASTEGLLAHRNAVSVRR
jgi:histidinol dehydrogenase